MRAAARAPRRSVVWALVWAVVWAQAVATTPSPAASVEHPGSLSQGRVRLADGRIITPPGRQIRVGDFPQSVSVTPDGRWALVSHSDYQHAGFSIVDLERGVRVQEVPLASGWLGIANYDAGRRIAVSVGLRNRIDLYDLAGGHATRIDSIVLGPPWSAGGQYPQGRVVDYGPGAIWPTGLSVAPAGTRAFVVSRLDSALYVVDLAARRVIHRTRLPGVPFTCRVSRRGDRVFVSLWDRGEILITDTTGVAVGAPIPVGPHPCEMVETPDGGRLFVAEAARNTVSVVDLAAGRVEETLGVSPDPAAPPGSTPVALDLDPDGRRLVVAEADANLLAWFDVSERGHARSLGFMSTGDYPTAVALVPARHVVLIANGKGAGSRPNSAAPPDTGSWCRYLIYDTGERGTLSMAPIPDQTRLASATRSVMRDLRPSSPVTSPGGPIPARPGDRTPIRHVFYVFKENRTYDSMLGDIPTGNGDPKLCLFGAGVTPNHHALARQFVLLDNTYCNADGSADGHNWGMAAYSNDYVTRSVGASPIYDYEGGNPLAYPEEGYLWDDCRRHGVTYRSYGEFVFNPDDPRDTVKAGIEGLVGHIAPHYRGFDLGYSDLDRYHAWLEEFDRYDRDGGLPQLEIIRLPNDHTEGTCSGRPTPRADVAENDLALGLMVERISHSRYWSSSAIFVIEDDAANGPDHVDAHRTVALVIGPHVKRGVVDHHLYTNASVLRTIELILGLPPMSQFDAGSLPMTAAFTSVADTVAFVHEPARVDLGEINLAGAYGQDRSDRMNFATADAAPPDELNEILWHDTRGVAALLPAPARAACLAACAAPDRKTGRRESR
jgi:DNA-binding beta-propeller fold protein YncE